MHDEVAYKDRLDVTGIEEGIQALVDRGAGRVPSPAIRRLAASADRPTVESEHSDPSTMEEQPIPTSALIAEREVTHGSFDENARVWQHLCDEANQTAFINDRQRLAFNMIALKIARLIQNPHVRDHWDDLGGYAKLGSEACE